MKKISVELYIVVVLILWQVIFAAENKLSHANIYHGAQKFNYATNPERFIPDHKTQVKKNRKRLK
jgi:hypothetical protein